MVPTKSTWPSAAATTLWPLLPAMSIPFFASSYAPVGLPSVGQPQLTASSGPLVSAALSAAVGAEEATAAGATVAGAMAAATGAVSGFCMSANAASEYGFFSPFGPVLFRLCAPCGCRGVRATPPGGGTGIDCDPPARLAALLS